jgi:Ca2+-binding EF-hand superfamily protein
MRALGFNVKKQEVARLVHEVDPHNNGTVDYDNFLEISTSPLSSSSPSSSSSS